MGMTGGASSKPLSILFFWESFVDNTLIGALCGYCLVLLSLLSTVEGSNVAFIFLLILDGYISVSFISLIIYERTQRHIVIPCWDCAYHPMNGTVC